MDPPVESEDRYSEAEVAKHIAEMEASAQLRVDRKWGAGEWQAVWVYDSERKKHKKHKKRKRRAIKLPIDHPRGPHYRSTRMYRNARG